MALTSCSSVTVRSAASGSLVSRVLFSFAGLFAGFYYYYLYYYTNLR
ncbi:MAG: hypothetical protein J5822_01720 [Eubacteriaceae bacterium]|nr:hypothetical protein [Eubacteriaceae bacterium]